MFRSMTMKHKKIRIPRDHAVEIMNELGKIKDGVEFLDLNKHLMEGQKNFFGMSKRCDENDKRINNVERICDRYGKVFVKFSSYEQFIQDLELEEKAAKRNNLIFFDAIEHEIIEDEKKMTELISSFDSIADNLDFIKEKKAVYDKISQLILSGNGEMFDLKRSKTGSSSDDEIGSAFSGIQTIAGVVRAEDEIKMKRMILRISRGRATPTFFDLEIKASASKDKLLKKIFTIFFPTGQDNVMFQKIIKVCEIYGASRFPLPRSDEMKNEISQLQRDIGEKEGYLKQAKTLIDDFLKDKVGYVQDNRPAKYELYRQFFKKEKTIYTNLNKCKLTDNFVDGAIWIPEETYPEVIEQVSKISINHALSCNFFDLPFPKESPPTYINLNDLTWAFQEMTNSYGVPRYREINPALFSIVTFPFLFGVMFGDIGHGILLLVFALYLVFWKDEIEKSDSLLKLALKARYMLLLMGGFATFCGFMYNDFLSIPLNIFGTCYKNVN